MGGAGFPPCWLFGLRQPNTGAYPCSLVGLMQTLGGLTPRRTSQNLYCQCPYPHGETEPPLASAGDPPTPAVRSGSVSNGETFYWLYILALLPNCYTSIVHVLLAVDLKQAVIHHE